MGYKNSILFQPGGKYPFLLATEADGIPLTVEELEALHSECEHALRLYDDAEIEDHRAEKMADQADFLNKVARENGV